MQYGVEERTIRSMRVVVIKCFKCGEEVHKCRECPLWQKQVRVACLVGEKAHQRAERKPACLEREKAQERDGKRKL